jgi:hypothetical protein
LNTKAFASIVLIVVPIFSVLTTDRCLAQETPNPVRYWTLLICGDDSGMQTFPRDAGYMYHVLSEHYAFDDIYYLHVDVSMPGVDGLATKDNIRLAINTTLASWSDENDVIFIFFTGHGGGYNDDEQALSGGRYEVGNVSDEGKEHYINNTWWGVDECLFIWEGKYVEYWDDELADDLNYLALQNKYGKLIFACLACYSGGLIDDISAPNRIIMTSANETHVGLADWYVEEGGYNGHGDLYSEWTEVFIDALHGKDTYWDPYKNLVIHKNASVDADFDNDGHVSMNEAWDYAWEYDDGRIHGNNTDWLDDNGNQRPTYLNETDIDAPHDPDDGNLAATIWFPQAWPVDVIRDGIIDIFDIVKVAIAFGSIPGNSNWDSVSDIIEDNMVDIFDVVAIAVHFGETSEFYVPPPEGLFGSSSLSGEMQMLLGDSTSISLYPSQITVCKGETFSVNITVNNVTDMYGWELKLYWNNTILTCTKAEVYVPAVWGEDNTKAGAGIQNTFNTTYGRYWKAVSALSPAPAFNGSMTIATLTFEAKATGTSVLDFQETKLSDNQASAISHSATDGSVTILPRTWFMRGDQHTINSLTAYKLWKPQSSTMRYYYESKPIYELSAEWGIQVWKRSQGGTETPISADKVAQVTRTNPGQGLQSATWNCLETTLSSTDAIVVRVYQRFEGFSWQLAATFITPQLAATKLNATTWTVYYYTKLYWTTSPSLQSKAYFYWGTTTYNSHIQNIEYA